jgi:hypothetical protein
LPLATLLLGYNSSASLSVAASVEALVRGVMQANAKFFETTGLAIHIDRLDIVELYIDTAISAVYALRKLAPQLATLGARHGTMIVCRSELTQGEGMRLRLSDERSSSYWPRLIIADAAAGDAEGQPARGVPPPVTLKTAAPVADRLRFTYVGQRARAESIAFQRQPGLVEQLVAEQIHNPTWNEDFGRMLFQLMVPHDFKDAARQLPRVVLVVDACTANLPWELMLADASSAPGERSKPLSTWPRWQQFRNTRSGTVSIAAISAAVISSPPDSSTPLRRRPSVCGRSNTPCAEMCRMRHGCA